jgi:hypothetical protein
LYLKTASTNTMLPFYLYLELQDPIPPPRSMSETTDRYSRNLA